MREFLKYSFVLLAGAGCVLAANDYLCKTLAFADSSNNSYKMWRLYKGYERNEVPILGSSRALASFVPSILGESMFNYGVNGSRQNETLRHLKAVLARNENNPIIINLDPWGINGERDWGDYSLVRWDSITKLPGIRYLGKVRELMDNFQHIVRERGLIVDRGAAMRTLVRQEFEWEIQSEKLNKDLLTFAVNENLMQEYEAVLSDEHPPIIFVITPIHRIWQKRFKGMDALEQLKKRLIACPNVILLDMMSGKEFAYPDDMFYDITHLNRNGALMFSKSLKIKLQMLGLGETDKLKVFGLKF